MKRFLEYLVALIWNVYGIRGPRVKHEDSGPLDLGIGIVEGEIRGHVTISQTKRAEHMVVLGRTGSGKSYFLRRLCLSDLNALRGFAFFDLHGDTRQFILSAIAELELRTHQDLSDRVILIDPADPEFSVGLNPLAAQAGISRFVQVAEFARLLRQRWNLDSFGARTDELLRNTLQALAEAGLTLLEIAPLLTHTAFRAATTTKVENPEVRQYFELRYDKLSDAMRTVMAEPILNKVSAFTGDPSFRHIVGQQQPRFSLTEALDAGRWIIVDVPKGRLGEHATTFAATFFTNLKNALFARQSRNLFSIYADEIQNLVASGSDIETVWSEARKFGAGLVSANQYLDQLPAEMRSALLAIGTHISFQLSSADATQLASAFDGGKPLAEILRNLPRRHFVVKSGHEPWREAMVPQVRIPTADPSDLVRRSREHWAKRRSEIEAEIRARQNVVSGTSPEDLHDWD